MKFCTKCGATLNDETVCPSCGAPVEDGAAPAATGTVGGAASGVVNGLKGFVAQAKTNPGLRNKLIIAGAILLLIIILCVCCGGRSEKKAVEEYLNASFKGDGKKIVSLLPDKMVKYQTKLSGQSKKDMIAEVDDDLKEFIEEFEDETGALASQVKIKVKLDKSGEEKKSKEEIKAANASLKLMGLNMKIQDAKTVKAEVELKYNGETRTKVIKVGLLKVGGKWCIESTNPPYVLFN